MANTRIKPGELSKAIGDQLTLYHEDVIERVNAAGEKAIKALVKLTKATAPKKSGDFAKNITHQVVQKTTGDKEFIWGVKAPKSRITHLLVHGHATENGGRVPGDPFLQEALDSVLPEYEEDVKEAMIP